MKVSRIEDMKDGWFIGDFEPSILRTPNFEVGYKFHKKGEDWPAHYHKGSEYNFLQSGKMRICGRIVTAGDLFVIEPLEVADPEFLEDCHVIVVKVPSKPGDKFIVNKEEKNV
jgi:quercetin dioxygenase-like cupin family protein